MPSWTSDVLRTATYATDGRRARRRSVTSPYGRGPQTFVSSNSLVHVRRADAERRSRHFHDAAALELVLAVRPHPEHGPALGGELHLAVTVVQDLPALKVGDG